MEIKKKKQLSAKRVELPSLTAKKPVAEKVVTARKAEYPGGVSAKELSSPSLSIKIPKKSKMETASPMKAMPVEGARPLTPQKMEGAKQIELPSIKAKNPSAFLPKIEKKKKRRQVYVGEPIDVVAKGK